MNIKKFNKQAEELAADLQAFLQAYNTPKIKRYYNIDNLKPIALLEIWKMALILIEEIEYIQINEWKKQTQHRTTRGDFPSKWLDLLELTIAIDQGVYIELISARIARERYSIQKMTWVKYDRDMFNRNDEDKKKNKARL